MKSFERNFGTKEATVSEKKNETKELRETKKPNSDIVNIGIQKAALDVIQEMRHGQRRSLKSLTHIQEIGLFTIAERQKRQRKWKRLLVEKR